MKSEVICRVEVSSNNDGVLALDFGSFGITLEKRHGLFSLNIYQGDRYVEDFLALTEYDFESLDSRFISKPDFLKIEKSALDKAFLPKMTLIKLLNANFYFQITGLFG